MSVLNSEEFEAVSHNLETVDDLSSHDEVATLLDDWDNDQSNDVLDWSRVLSVYQDKVYRGYCFLLTEEGGPSTEFDLFDFIEGAGGPHLTSLTARRVVGKGRGPSPSPTSHSRYAPEPETDVSEADSVTGDLDHNVFGEGNPDGEDEVSTGFFEDDDEDDFGPTTPVYTGRVFTLKIERTDGIFDVGPTSVRVGRGSNCEVQILGNKRMSRVHAIFTVEDDELFVEDQGSANGSHVGGFALSGKTPVSPGSVVSLGGEVIRVLSI